LGLQLTIPLDTCQHVLGVRPHFSSYTRQVPLEDGVESWLAHLKDGISDTLKDMLNNAIQDVRANKPLEDIVFKV